MTVSISWQQIALRLFLTVVAGALIGYNRSERGRAAGLRTNILVCLAASVAMIQVNLLLGMTGKQPGSFITNDLMRLPLGILSGMGFIGAGAILRRENMVVGVTTAATLWFVTVVGLCLGGGQLGLGLSALVLGLIVLWVFEWVEEQMRQDCIGTLLVITQANGPEESEIRGVIKEAGMTITSLQVTFDNEAHDRELCWSLAWRGEMNEEKSPAFLTQLARQPGVRNVQWKPMTGRGH